MHCRTNPLIHSRHNNGWEILWLSADLRATRRSSSHPTSTALSTMHPSKSDFMEIWSCSLAKVHVHAYIQSSNSLTYCAFLGVEKNNDVAKHQFYSSNRHDPCGEVLRTEKRLEQLDHTCRRKKRSYHKRDMSYWSDGISQQRAAVQRWVSHWLLLTTLFLLFLNGFSKSHHKYKSLHLHNSYFIAMYMHVVCTDTHTP